MIRDKSRLVSGAMRACRCLLALVMGGLAAMPALAHSADYTIGAPPAWVVPVTPGVSSSNELGQSSEGETYLLTDTQLLASDRERVTYRRIVSSATNAHGVESIANIQIPFDPSYQTLVLHTINIVRDGKVIPKLAAARIQVLQRETELEAQVYDGTKTVNVFLDDVRVGDAVDYSYTVTGRNPVFKGHDFGAISLQFGVPVARIHMRLLWSPDKHMVFTARNTSIKPSMSDHDGLHDYVWDVADVAALHVEDGAPAWYSPFAEVQWSDYADWAAVVRWALPLYQVPVHLSPALQEQVDRIASAEPTPGGRMLAALRLVQSDVRYLGVEIGQNSHAPNAPELVYARRFGDCKDKTLLTLTLLSHLGIEAHAALVNTTVRRGVADALPRPSLFDHVLVQARVDGKSWWLDPTRYTQKADLAHLFQPDFGVALIVAPGTQGLVPMQRPAADASSRHLHVVFDASAGFNKPVRFTVETIANGETAESLRSYFSSTSQAEIQKRYLNFYAQRYPHISVAAPLQFSDDEPNNRVVTKESYSIAGIATVSDDGRKKFVAIHMPDLLLLLNDPDAPVRKSPLQVGYPVDVSQDTEVLLPESWPITPHTSTVDDPAFHFEQAETIDGLRLHIADHFQSLADEVAAKDMERYVGNLDKARDVLGYELNWTVETPAATTSVPPQAGALDRMNWPIALLAVAMCGFWIWLAVVVYKYDPSPSDKAGNQWVGIRGWLLVLAVVLVFRPPFYVYFLKDLFDATTVANWSALTTYGSKHYSALWAPILLFELAVALWRLVFSLLLLLLLFQRRSSFPRVALLFLIGTMALTLLDRGLVHLLPAVTDTAKDVQRIVGSMIGTLIWSCYLLKSERVKDTFVMRHRVRRSPLPLAQEPTSAA